MGKPNLLFTLSPSHDQRGMPKKVWKKHAENIILSSHYSKPLQPQTNLHNPEVILLLRDWSQWIQSPTLFPFGKGNFEMSYENHHKDLKEINTSFPQCDQLTITSLYFSLLSHFTLPLSLNSVSCCHILKPFSQVVLSREPKLIYTKYIFLCFYV